MGLKNCPKCNLMLFDTDTECIYCGWKEETHTEQTPPEAIAADTVIESEATDISPESIAEEAVQPEPEHMDVPVTSLEDEKTADIEDIQKSFESLMESSEIDIEDTIEDEIVDIEDTIDEPEESFFTEEDYNNGIRYLEGTRFNLFDIIEKHGAANKVQIIKEIREKTETSLKNAVKVLDNALDDFFEYEGENHIDDEVLDYVPDKQIQQGQYEHPKDPATSVKDNIHRALAYNMVIRRGPDRKAQIIDELMRSVHISLFQATEAVEDAIQEYREHTKSD